MINGNDIIVYVGSDAIAATKSNEMQSQCEVVEVASPTSGQWREYIPGRKDWQVNAQCLVSSASNIQQMLQVGSVVTIAFKDRSANTLLSGSAIMTQADYQAIRGNKATGTFQFVGTGALTAPSS